MFDVHCMTCGEVTGECEIEGSTGLCTHCLEADYPKPEEEAA